MGGGGGKGRRVLASLVRMGRPRVSPGMGIAVRELGALTIPGTGRTATADESRSRNTATAKSPFGDTVKSLGIDGSGTRVVAPPLRETTAMEGMPSVRTSA